VLYKQLLLSEAFQNNNMTIVIQLAGTLNPFSPCQLHSTKAHNAAHTSGGISLPFY
jgi:hypothetical protein